MRLVWKSECFLCEAPLNPCVRAHGRRTKEFIRMYRSIRPLFTTNNDKFYSFLGGRLNVKPVCYACFLNKPKVNIKALKHREIGVIRHLSPRPKAKTKDEILQWYDGLIRRALKNGIDIT